jgi:hypothetical protein
VLRQTNTIIVRAAGIYLLGQRGQRKRARRGKSGCSSALPMDARARTPRGARKVAVGSGEPGGSDKEWRWRGWRAAARAGVVAAVGFLGALVLLVMVFGGRTGRMAAFSSAPGTGFFVQKPGKVRLVLVHTHVEFSDADRCSWTCFLCIFIVFMMKSTLEPASMRLFFLRKKKVQHKSFNQSSTITMPIIHHETSQTNFGVLTCGCKTSSSKESVSNVQLTNSICIRFSQRHSHCTESLRKLDIQCSTAHSMACFFFYQHSDPRRTRLFIGVFISVAYLDAHARTQGRESARSRQRELAEQAFPSLCVLYARSASQLAPVLTLFAAEFTASR